jgi:hypothetical protein
MTLRKTELIGIEPIQDLIELTLYTAYVKDERIVSLMIVAKPESGKTELGKKYRKNNGVIGLRRFSAYGVQKALIEGKFKPLFPISKILGHLLIYDFNYIFSYKMSTVDSTMAFLDALTEEGLQPQADYAISPDALEGYEGLRGGVIAFTHTLGFFTPRGKNRIKKNLLKGGFFSRNILVSYDLGASVFDRALEGLIEGDYRARKNYVDLIKLKLPLKRCDVSIHPKYSRELIEISKDIVEDIERDLGLREEIRGIRLAKSLIALAKASALRDGRRVVNAKDVRRIRFLSNWMNIKFNNLKTKYSFYEGLD